jgi:hypothetical protein
MNERIEKLARQNERIWNLYTIGPVQRAEVSQFVEAIVEETLTQVAERAYYTGDRDWSDEVDRPWIQLEFGYGPLAEMKK